MKQFTSKKQKIGALGEDIACKHLLSLGFTLVERNISNKYGEIDIVARKGDHLYFFEVKTGKKDGLVYPAENLTKSKIRKVFISAQHYSMMNSVVEYKIQGIIVIIEGQGASVEIIDLF